MGAGTRSTSGVVGVLGGWVAKGLACGTLDGGPKRS